MTIALAEMARNLDVYGCAHIVVDDWNVDDEDLEWALNWCRSETEHGNFEYSADDTSRAITWLTMMQQASYEERVSALALVDVCLPVGQSLETDTVQPGLTAPENAEFSGESCGDW